ncbi:MAG TPA: carbohydrate ABC transporter permease [Aggregatilineales bacterium]|nr:carbohydrate ABC transporter permease [Aggregatilineales bacterium]
MISGQSRLWRGISTALLVFVAFIFLIPLLWMISSSLKPSYAVLDVPPSLFPNPVKWSNYPEAMSIVPFGRFMLNSFFISVVTVVGHLVSCTLIAYGFARLRAPGKDVLFWIVLGTMMLPYPVTMVPVFMLFHALGWIDTFLPLTVPAFFGSPFYIFLLRQFFMTLPPELEEAARIDGATTFEIITRIVVPLSGPALATVTLFTFQATWNDFLGPLIYLGNQQLYTVTLGLNQFRQSYTTDWAYLMAASLVTMLPVVIIFVLGQKYFVEGITLTGLKG